MCASVYSSLLLFTLTTVSIHLFGAKTEGLPLVRQERGADRGVLAGADFLSVFMSSSLRLETTTTEPALTRATRSTSDHTEQSSPETTLSARPPGRSSDSGDGVVVAVRVSSSVGSTLIHKEAEPVASEEPPSIVAEAKKSEFSVEESEPITANSDFFEEYPASVQPIPGPFGEEGLLRQSVVYHEGPREPGRARSVSYSTVVQAVPRAEEKRRRERHFDAALANDFREAKNGSKKASGWPESSAPFTTERNWELREKSYPRLPPVYGKPEQNYEVDESASVMTNGRVHGIQQATPTSPSKEVKIGESRKADDNQKVGYVVEGRNYRKYRVEEKTPDGFIVGEYGVVSHDDGSLRGVRYTADGTISPKLIYDALMKFLSL